MQHRDDDRNAETPDVKAPDVQRDVPRRPWATPRVIEASVQHETAGGAFVLVPDSTSPGFGLS